jgi:hypothetical protein
MQSKGLNMLQSPQGKLRQASRNHALLTVEKTGAKAAVSPFANDDSERLVRSSQASLASAHEGQKLWLPGDSLLSRTRGLGLLTLAQGPLLSLNTGHRSFQLLAKLVELSQRLRRPCLKDTKLTPTSIGP